MLRKYRRIGSMEQLFVCLNDLKLDWGAACSCVKVDGLSQISTNKLQAIWNKLFNKYESLQSQILTIKSMYQFDWVYIGCLPYKISRHETPTHKEDLLHELYLKEMNHRFLLLNDFNLTAEDIENKKYDIHAISPLYRIVIYNDYIIINIQHAIGDGLCLLELQQEFMKLINDDSSYSDKVIKFQKLEDCINPKYASSPFLNQMINYLVPTWFAMWFSKIYANNSYLSKYNPLSLHSDDILRFKHMYCHRNMFKHNGDQYAFPLSVSYDKMDWRIDNVYFKLDKNTSANILSQCKLHKVHLSSLIMYIANAATIECHNNILKKDYYKTVIGNMFSARPLFIAPNGHYFGMMAVPYNNMIEYYKSVVIGSDRFWEVTHKITQMLLDVDDNKIVNVYKNKFPFLNTKKWIRYTWNNLLGKMPMGPPTISNLSVCKLNKNDYKYKATSYLLAANPAVGFGAPYISGAVSIKGIDELDVSYIYGTQFIAKDVAQRIVNKMEEKFKMIASSNTNYQSKL
eukprot:485678_1